MPQKQWAWLTIVNEHLEANLYYSRVILPLTFCRSFTVRLPNFHGIVTSFEQYPRDWNIWYTSAEPEVTPLPGEKGWTCGWLFVYISFILKMFLTNVCVVNLFFPSVTQEFCVTVLFSILLYFLLLSVLSLLFLLLWAFLFFNETVRLLAGGFFSVNVRQGLTREHETHKGGIEDKGLGRDVSLAPMSRPSPF